jgi:septal ring-binding cell division protein DamX
MNSSMKKSDYLFFVLLACVVVVIIYIISRGYKHPFGSSEITIKDLTASEISLKKNPGPDSIKPERRMDNDMKAGKDEFYIIIGSFKTAEEAQQLARNIKKGTNAETIVFPGTAEGYYRVSYGRYPTLEEAKSVIKVVRTNIKPDAWILAIKKGS